MSDASIRVVCRFRPQNKIEDSKGAKVVVDFPDTATVAIKGSETNMKFTFDRVFPPTTPQAEIYDYAARPIVEDVLKGYNGTVFAYGQTSSGKTHTMEGPAIDDITNRGVIPRMVKTIFDGVSGADSNIEFTVKISYLEIYQEKIRDLLDHTKGNLQVREEKERGIWVDGATEVYASCEKDVFDIMRAGASNRKIGETKMNFESSRSHSIFVVTVSQKNLSDQSNKTGKLYLVDLAGSEKVGKTGAEGLQLEEAKQINKSLSALGNVINSLTDGKSSHIPYRDSKLTRVLQESLGGNSRTTLIICCSPSSYNEVETVSTLRFGLRAKTIKNKPKINQEKSPQELKRLLGEATQEIARLKALLSQGQNSSSDSQSGLLQTLQVQIEELQNQIHQLKENEEKLVTKNQETEARIESIDDEYKSAMQQIQQLQERIQNLEEENAVLVSKATELNFQYEKELHESQEKDILIDNLKQMNSKLQSDIEVFQATQLRPGFSDREAHSRHEKILSTLSSHGEQLMVLNIEDDPQSSEVIQRLESELAAKSEAEEQLSQALEKIQIEKKEADESLEQSNKQIEELEERLRKLLTEVTQTQSAAESVPTLVTENERLLSELKKMQEEVRQTKKENQASMDLKVDQLKQENESKFTDLQKQVSKLTKEIADRDTKVLELQVALDQKKEVESQKNRNDNARFLQQRIRTLEESQYTLTRTCTKLMTQKTQSEMELKVATQKLLNRSDRIAVLETQIRDLQATYLKPKSDQRQTLLEEGPASETPQESLSFFNLSKHIAKPLRGGKSS